jgi:MoaA/NifB/PqqE/SkfB family radical SAM enzyme
MLQQSLYHTYKRYQTLRTHKITALPLVILMPHSACNCRCIMCDIWKGNQNLRQLHQEDIHNLLGSLRKLGTQQVLMSGGEALLNPHFFDYCSLLKKEGISISLLSTGLSIGQYAKEITEHVNQLILSIDGPEQIHDRIRNIPGAFQKISRGIHAIRSLQPGFPISARTVIHKHNYKYWPAIVDAALELEFDQISFLPADVSSHAFNRQTGWDMERQAEIRLTASELEELELVMEYLFTEYASLFSNHFIAEHPEKIKKIAAYYSALLGNSPFPYKKCNAPWVSVVVEADGTVRPCFFHEPIGTIRTASLGEIINNEKALQFRKELDMNKDPVCVKCVCYLNLSPAVSIR